MIYSSLSASLLLLFLMLLVPSSSPLEPLDGELADDAFHDDSKVSPFLLPSLVSAEVWPAVDELDMVGEALICDVAIVSHQLQRSSKLEELMVVPSRRLLRSSSALVRGNGVWQRGSL